MDVLLWILGEKVLVLVSLHDVLLDSWRGDTKIPLSEEARSNTWRIKSSLSEETQLPLGEEAQLPLGEEAQIASW